MEITKEDDNEEVSSINAGSGNMLIDQCRAEDFGKWCGRSARHSGYIE
jgi:hypothetical protein